MGGRGSIAVGFLLLMGQPTAAQENAAKPVQPAVNVWTITCASTNDASKLECQMIQNLSENKTGQRILAVTVRKDASGKMGMVLTLPHGVYLPAGATYQVDEGEKSPAAIQTADQNGSYALVALTDPLVDQMRRGKTLNVGMETASRAPVTIPVTLAGFAVTYAKLEAID